MRSIVAGKAPPTANGFSTLSITRKIPTMWYDVINVGEVVDSLGEGEVLQSPSGFKATGIGTKTNAWK